MNIYRNFNEQELLIAYNELLDNSGNINRDMQEILTERGYDEEFFAKANHKKVIVKEKGRIAFEVNKMVEKGHFFEEIEPEISSDILNEDELFNFILEKYIIFKSNHENEKVDKKTFYKSFLSVFVGTFAGISFLYLIVNFFQVFNFFFLIPTYVVCYLVIRKITGKTRDNLAVFISTFLATTSRQLSAFCLLKVFINFKFHQCKKFQYSGFAETFVWKTTKVCPKL